MFLRQRLRPFLVGALVATAGLASLNGISYAATGQGLILGHSNSADKTTTISRTTHGAALALHVKAHQAPLAVNSKVQVKKLNASYVGGLTAHSLQTRDLQYTVPSSASAVAETTYTLPSIPAGTYYTSFAIIGRVSAAGEQLDCVVETTSSFTTQLLGYGGTYGTYSTVSAGGVLTVSKGEGLQFRCFTSAGTYTIYTSSKSIVDFVKIDGRVSRTAAPAPAIAHARVPAHPSATGR